ncbi:MAG: hypothetical protein AAB538_06365, partial [Patescibacteria group bacterium]
YWGPDSITVPTGYAKFGNAGLGDFATPEFSTPPGDFNSTTGIFTPTVPGKYLLTASNWTLYGLFICKNGADPAGAPGGCAKGWATTQGAKVFAVFDANGAGDSFQLWGYSNSNQIVRGGPTHYSFFSGTRVGSPATEVPRSYLLDVTTPDRMVMFFNNRTLCPPGWLAMDGSVAGVPNMLGMYVVASTGSSVGQSPAGITRLSPLQNRATGAHEHTIPALNVNTLIMPALRYLRPRFNHGNSTNIPSHGFENYRADVRIASAASGSTIYAYSNLTSSAAITGGTTIQNTTGSGGVSTGTNAPYVQLLACQRN